jgi:hypothetical protein
LNCHLLNFYATLLGWVGGFRGEADTLEKMEKRIESAFGIWKFGRYDGM